MRLTALGTNASCPGPDNACSGWLVEHGDARLLVDCGTGVIARLQQFLPLRQITGIVISHMHADHFFDLVPLRYGFKYGIGIPDPTPRLYLPPQGMGALNRVAAALDAEPPEQFFAEVFAVEEYNPAGALQIDTISVRFAPGSHYIPSWAVALEADGRRVVYTADTGPSAVIEEFARGADLLIAEATYLSPAEESGSRRGHLTARETGELAARAAPRRALITHLWPHRDAAEALREAAHVFDGEIDLARAGAGYEV